MSHDDDGTLLVFGAHPDDIEFGCGAVIALETQAGRSAHFAICSRGESGTNGTPSERVAESEKAAAALGATLEFVELDGDAHLEIRVGHALKLAEIIRRIRPSIVMAPSRVQNQHPDHSRLGSLVGDAARLARYGGIAELSSLSSHSIDQLFFYAITPEAEPRDISPLFVDISSPTAMAAWTASMEAHLSQMRTRNYIELQMTRARLLGLRAGADYAMAIFPNDPPVVESLSQMRKGARRY